MALPDLIEIVPLTQPVRAEITVPGSKSITNRALILAALADGEVTLTGALWSEDTQVMTEALRTLGFDVRVENDSAEFCNRTITVKGQGGKIPKAGTVEKPLELFVGNAGTAARFLAAMVCLGDGVYRLSGVPRMHERPQAALFKALRELGYRVDATSDKLPAIIFGAGRGCVADQPQQCGTAAADASRTAALRNRSCTVSIDESSQFASALLLSAKHGGWNVKVAGDDDEEAPYVRMTERLVKVFPWGGGKFQIEPDASSGSYFWAAGFDIFIEYREERSKSGKVDQTWQSDWSIKVKDWSISGWQFDAKFPDQLRKVTYCSPSFEIEPAGHEGKRGEMMAEQTQAVVQAAADFEEPLGGYVKALKMFSPQTTLSRQLDLADSIMTAVAIAPLAVRVLRFTELGRLRVQECERVVALRTELTKCGAKVVEEGDTLTVYPSKLHGAEIETYNDHRMAMCFAILGLKVPGIRLKNPACVKKTFPNFFQKLAAAPPNGLGVEIWEVKAGQRTRKLEGEDLFAD